MAYAKLVGPIIEIVKTLDKENQKLTSICEQLAIEMLMHSHAADKNSMIQDQLPESCCFMDIGAASPQPEQLVGFKRHHCFAYHIVIFINGRQAVRTRFHQFFLDETSV